MFAVSLCCQIAFIDQSMNVSGHGAGFSMTAWAGMGMQLLFNDVVVHTLNEERKILAG
jgi:hypothetical protein